MYITTESETRGLNITLHLDPFVEPHTADVLMRPGWLEAVVVDALEHEVKGRPRVMLRLDDEEAAWLKARGGINKTITRLILEDNGGHAKVSEKREYKLGLNSIRVEIRDRRAADLLGQAVNPQAYCKRLIRDERWREKVADEAGVI